LATISAKNALDNSFGGSEILRFQAGMLRDTRKHPWPDFVAILEGHT
jgi:hypothetical protein